MAIARRRSSGGSALTIQDEGITVDTNTNTINFVGTDVSAYGGSGLVTVYIPALAFSPYFNQGAAALNNVGSLRNIPAPDSEGTPFYIGTWVPGTQHTTINTNPTWGTASEFSISDLTTTLTVTVRDVSTTGNVIATHALTLTGNTASTANDITITVYDWAAEYFKYRANVDVLIDFASLLPQGGRFYIVITHANGTEGTYQKTQTVFYDPNTVPAAINGTVTITENTIVGKYLSGLYYYTNGDTFDIAVTDIDYLNDRSYPSTQLVVNSATYGIPNQSLTGAGLTGWSTLYDVTGVSYLGNNLPINVGTCYNFIGTNAHITAQVYDWAAGMSRNSADQACLIDTCSPNSDELSEFFTDEDYRLESDLATPWDSTQPLNTYDSGSGLMVQAGLLQTPRGNWTGYSPTLNPNYSTMPAGNYHYYRRFTDVSSLVRTNATLSFSFDAGSGFNALYFLENSLIEIWINIPGRFTGPCYLHGADTFNAPIFNSDPQNKSLRLASSVGNTIYVSFGNFGLNALQNYFEFELIINTTNSTIRPSSIVVSW